MTNFPVSVLIDKRNFYDLQEELIKRFAVSDQFNGFDLETEDSLRHEGLNRAMKMDEDGFKGGNTKLLFDVNRTTICGFSLYADNDQAAFYFNVAHADVENRIPVSDVVKFLTKIRDAGAYFLAHKAPFELCMTWKCWSFHLGPKVICTLQLAVSCFNDDTYPMDKFLQPGFGEAFEGLAQKISRTFMGFQNGDEMTNEQEELLFKFIAKESSAAHSYNGFVKEIHYGYGLKALSLYFLKYQQKTFSEVLGDHPHMGCLTGEEVCSYGADDAWVCVWLYHKLMAYAMETNPKVIKTFFEQENPMIYQYAQVWGEGVVTDLAAVMAGRVTKRKELAELFKRMKANIRELLPFPSEPHEKLMKYDPKGYFKSWAKYRREVIAWANSPDSDNEIVQIMQVRSSVSKQIAEEMGLPESKGPNLTYYQVVRCVLYDLCECSFQLSNGKIQSDSDARALMRSRMIKKAGIVEKEVLDEKGNKTGEIELVGEDARAILTIKLLDSYSELAGIDQFIKLYINKYMNLIDPDTNRVYPVLSSQLNSHRMALEEPNLSQLAKFSDLKIVRTYFEPDEKDHVLVSADWSAIELLLIGEMSGDPVFAKAYGQLPHDDLHSETVCALLDLTLEVFKEMPNKKQLRTELGKPANFGYWYSGALGTVAKELGWSSEQMWEYVEKYRSKFAVGEQWRTGTIAFAQENGYVDLPDGHRRYRFESTGLWVEYMRQKFAQYGPAVAKFGDIAIRKIRNRSGNQAVNSIIQGTGATLAKRTVIKIDPKLEFPVTRIHNPGGYKARFKFPVHDELVYSVHRNHVLGFIPALREAMCTHPEIVKNLKLDVGIAIGRNYLAWDEKSNPKGQIELDEASKVPCLPKDRWGQKLTIEEQQKVLDYLFE